MSKTSSAKGKKCPRLRYSKETLKEAIAAIKAGMPINTASNKYQIPRSTLHNKKTAKYADKRPGPETILTTAEELSLVQWISNCSKQNMPVSKQQLLNSVALLVKLLARENPFANGRPGRHWYQSFLRRHPNVQAQVNENYLSARAAASEADVKQWFAQLKASLEIKNLLNIHPSRIFTTETLTLQNPCAGEDKENLSVQIAGNAAGQLLAPMMLFTFKRIPGKVYERLPQGWTCGKSDSGNMTAENFHEYLTKTFWPWLQEKKTELPVVLFVDGRVSHLTLSATDFCLRNKIELAALYPNASNVLQPLELAMFPQLKAAWREALNNYRSKTKFINMLKEETITLLKSVLDVLDVKGILMHGFKVAGLCPLMENVVNYKRIVKKVQMDKAKEDRMEFTPYVPEEEMFEAASMLQEPVVNEQFLQTLEKFLDIDQLRAFKSVDETEQWNGRIEDTSLFYVWRRIASLCTSDVVGGFACLQQNAVSEFYNSMSVGIITLKFVFLDDFIFHLGWFFVAG